VRVQAASKAFASSVTPFADSTTWSIDLLREVRTSGNLLQHRGLGPARRRRRLPSAASIGTGRRGLLRVVLVLLSTVTFDGVETGAGG
jgi:hypothetical protein